MLKIYYMYFIYLTMKLELIIFAITSFLVVNSYCENKYIQKIISYKKYFEMATYAFVGFSLYLMVKRNPNQSRSMMSQVSNIIKHMPIDRNASSMLTPLFDINDNINGETTGLLSSFIAPQQKRMLNSGNDSTKRSVSETKKKWVASQQNWKCGLCNVQLQAWFEVDHRIELENGGSNHVNNLIALCRDCHGKKTMMSRL